MDDTRQRAVHARVLVQQPFWQELVMFARSLEQGDEARLRDAKYATPDVIKGLHQRWIVTHELIDQILRYPQAAIDAAVDSTRSTPDWGGEGDNTQQGQ